jgi:predicted ATPase
MVGRARLWVANSFLYAGNFSATLAEFKRIESAADQFSVRATSKKNAVLWNWRMQSRSFASFALWTLGYPERAAAKSRESFVVARDIGASPFDFAVALWWSAVLNVLLRDWESARLQADEAISLAHEHGMMSILDLTDTVRGWTLGEIGQREEGLAQMLGSRTQVMQDRTVIAFWLFEGLANSYLAAGDVGKGLETVAEGLELAQHTGRRIFESDLRRLKGELILLGDDGEASEAAQCFRDAIEVARRQSAKSWELRATMSLVRLLLTQARHDEARTMLADVYNWFTEGFETADLKDAKALLDELSGG